MSIWNAFRVAMLLCAAGAALTPALAHAVITQVAPGGHHSCAVTTAGAVLCWGDNQFGQLGNGGTAPATTAQPVPGLASGVVALASGGDHTCALTSGGAVKCWGQNTNGQLGVAIPNPATAPTATPIDVPGHASGIAAITAGEFHTCSLSTAGAVRCWGANQFGQVGNATTSPVDVVVPTPVSGLSAGVRAISSHESHTCAVLSSGAVRCWGLNTDAQLGSGGFAGNRPNGGNATPQLVVGLSGPAQAVAVGRYHSCARVGAGMQCWGRNDRGQLGNGTVYSPAPVTPAGMDSGVARIAAAWNTTCAVRTDAEVRCWGDNQFGQVGVGFANSFRDTPSLVVGLPGDVSEAAPSYQHTCFLRRDGSVRCTGINPEGRLGIGVAGEDQSTPYDVVDATLAMRADSVSAGGAHACAIDRGAAWCWGRNAEGQLGNGGNTPSAVPVAVTGLASGVTSIAAGGRHACAVVSGAVKCWGANDAGQLGVAGAASTTPLDIPSLASGVNAVTAGENHTCALLASGTVRCWGANARGQLGDGSVEPRSTPVDVGTVANAVAISAGEQHTCAVEASGTARCWGWNEHGQLGNGTLAGNGSNQEVRSPVTVSVVAGSVTAIAAGRSHTCAIVAGAARCWGRGDAGQLGNALASNNLDDVQVIGLGSGVSGITASANQSCAITAAGATRCWGEGADGQLGHGSGIAFAAAPVDVVSLGLRTRAVSAGAANACAITGASGAPTWLRCWGRNAQGQLGDGTQVSRAIEAHVRQRRAQAITLPLGPTIPYGVTTAAGSSATSGLPVTVDGWTPSTCSVGAAGVTPSALGLCGVRASQAGDAAYAAAPQQLALVEVVKGSQAIVFGDPGMRRFGDAPFAITATGGATGNPVVLAGQTPAVCSLSGSTVTIVAAGLCRISATQAGNSLYEDAPLATLEIPVGKGDQAITFPAQPGRTYAPGGTFSVAPLAQASSGLAVAYGTLTPAACTVTGTTVSIVGAGTCTLAANQPGDANWNAAPEATRDVAIAQASQAIDFPAQPAAPAFVANATFAISPLASASTGFAIAYGSATPATCSIAGTTVTILGAGTCRITADQAGDANYAAAPQVFRDVTIARAAQAITFDAQVATPTYAPGSTFPVAPLASASSGLAIAYASTTPATCSLSGTTVNVVGAGTCTIAADQAGDANFLPAPRIVRSVAIAKSAQAITFGAQAATPTYAPSGTFAISPLASASSGLGVSYGSNTPATCSVAGSTVTILGAGTCTIAASQGGDDNYEPAATQAQSVTIAKSPQSIDFPAQTTRGRKDPAYTVGATAAIAPVTFTSSTPAVCTATGTHGATVTLVGVGTCQLAADQAGDANYLPAPQAVRSFTVVSAPQTTITSAPPAFANSASATFVFESTDPGSFECALDGGAFTPCTTPRVVNALADGPHTFWVRAIDTDGGIDPTPATHAWTVDTAAPSLAITAKPVVSLANQAAYVLAGTCSDDGRPIAIQVGSVATTATCGVPATGQYATPALDLTGLAQGPVALTVSIADLAGNTTTVNDATAKDTIGPVLAIDALDPIGNGNKAAYAFGGHCEAGRTVAYALVAGATVSGSTGCVGGTFDVLGLDVTTLGDGLVSFVVTQSDAAGNTATANGSVAKDTVNPLVTLDAVLPVSAARAAATLVSGTCSENGRVVQVSIGSRNATPACASGAFQAILDLAAEADGTLTVTANHVDAAANVATATRSVVKDTISPAAPSVTAPTGTVASAQPTIGGTSEANAQVTVRVDGDVVGVTTANAAGAWTLALAAPLAERAHSATAIAMDAVGNTSPASAPRSFFVAPTLTMAPAALGNGAVGTDYVASLSTSGNGLAPYGYAVTAGALPPGVALSSAGVFSGAPAASGTFNFTVRSTDADTANGPFTATRAFTIQVGAAAQTITFATPPDRALGAGPFVASASASSGLAVAFSSLTPATCAVAGSTVTPQARGTCTLAADQPGNGNFTAAPRVTRSFAVFDVPGAPIAGTAFPGNAQATLTFAAPADDGGSAITGFVATCLPAGATQQGNASPLVVTGLPNGIAQSCTVRATNAAGNGVASAAMDVLPSLQQITFAPATLAFGGQSMGTTSPELLVTMTNNASAAVSLLSASASAQFSVTHGCTAALAPGASCVLRVRFSPLAAAGPLNAAIPVNGTLAIASSGPGSPHVVALQGVAEKSLVSHYYRSILRRAPDAGGHAFWTGEAARLAGLGADPNETWYAMAATFFASGEYAAFQRNDAAFVADLYGTFFNRQPDAGGLAFWLENIAGGMPREVVLVAFMFSAEFRAFSRAIFGEAPARPEQDTVNDFYRGLLARLPDSDGNVFWAGRFRAAQCQGAAAIYAEVEAISRLFVESGEYAARQRTPAQFVGDLYDAFLRRGGDLAGVRFWIDQVTSGARTRSQVRGEFLASPEFSARVQRIVDAGCAP